jgi:prephenate dehydrogenase
VTTGSTIGIVGTGLIGGSIGLRAGREGARAIGYDEDPGALAAALNAGAIAEGVTRGELYARADTVVIAAHLDATVAEVKRLRAQRTVRATLIVDVASVKAPVCAAAGTLASFVATHPMAGSEGSGAAAARADLFDGRIWAYIPSGDSLLDERARAFIVWQGAAPFAVAAAEHDRIVALTSHVPQLVAWAYARQARAHAGETFDQLTGATARELLRVGASGVAMWRDILRANGSNVAPELRALGLALLEAADHLSHGNVEAALWP